MGTPLTGLAPKDTYQGLLQVPGGLSGSLKAVEDGLGAATPLSVSTGAVAVTGGLSATSFAGSGAGLTALNASALASGTVAAARLPAFSGDVSSAAGSSVFAIGAGKVTNAMLAGSIPASKLVGTDIAAVGTLTAGTLALSASQNSPVVHSLRNGDAGASAATVLQLFNDAGASASTQGFMLQLNSGAGGNTAYVWNKLDGPVVIGTNNLARATFASSGGLTLASGNSLTVTNGTIGGGASLGLSNASASTVAHTFRNSTAAGSVSLNLLTDSGTNPAGNGLVLLMNGTGATAPNAAYLWNRQSGVLSFGTAQTERMTIGASGGLSLASGNNLTLSGGTISVTPSGTTGRGVEISLPSGSTADGLRVNLNGATKTKVLPTGDVEVVDASAGVVLKSPDGTRYRVTVNNGGTLAVAAA